MTMWCCRGVKGLRAFGSETEMEAIGGVMARHLETMRNKHAITLEHLRMGALRARSSTPAVNSSTCSTSSGHHRATGVVWVFDGSRQRANQGCPAWSLLGLS